MRRQNYISKSGQVQLAERREAIKDQKQQEEQEEKLYRQFIADMQKSEQNHN